MAKSVDSDQTQHFAASVWVCTFCSDLSVQRLRINAVYIINREVIKFFESLFLVLSPWEQIFLFCDEKSDDFVSCVVI